MESGVTRRHALTYLRAAIDKRPLLAVPVATNGCLAEAKPARGRSERRAALEKSDRQVWVGFDRSSVSQQWLVSSIQLTFVGRLL